MGFWEKLIGPSKKERFVKKVIEAIRETGETRPVHYDADQFQLRVGDDSAEQVDMSLTNVYAEYCVVPRSEHANLLRRFVSAMRGVDFPEHFEEAKPHLFPRVRERAFYTNNLLRFQLEHGDHSGMPFRVLGDHLAVGPAYDMPDGIAEIAEDQFARWGVTVDQALTIARENLRQQSRAAFDSPVKGIYLSPWRDNYDASRLVLDDLLRQYEVKGDYVAMVPNRDPLILTGSEDGVGLAAMLELTEAALEQPRPMSGIPVRWRNGKWSTYCPDKDHPGLDGYKRLRLLSRSSEYGEQKELLDALHEKTGKDLFVASYSLVENKETKALGSYSVWAKGVVTILPQSEKVVFMAGDNPVEAGMAAMSDWEHVCEVVGNLMTPQDVYPPCFLVKDYPTPSQLAAIGRDESIT